MQRDLTVGAPVGGLWEGMEISFSYSVVREAFVLVAWIDWQSRTDSGERQNDALTSICGRSFTEQLAEGKSPSFWMMLDTPQQTAARFTYTASLNGREGFELAEVCPARDPALRTPGRLWLPLEPRWEEI